MQKQKILQKSDRFYRWTFFATLFSMCMLMVAAIVVSQMVIGSRGKSGIVRDNATIQVSFAMDLNIGDYVNDFGTYNNRALRWRVIAKDDQGVMLQTERIISQEDDTALVMPYSDTSDTVPAGYPHKSEFINNYVSHKDLSQGSESTYRTDQGTSYWEQSTARYFLNNDFINAFDTQQQNAIVSNPKVKTLLYWTEVTAKISDNVDTTFSAPPKYTAMIVRPEDSFVEAEQFSGKTTYLQGTNCHLVYGSPYADAEQRVPYVYQNSPYYWGDDTVFFAPVNILVDLWSTDLKNPAGQKITQALDYADQVIVAATSLSVMNWGGGDYGYGGSGPIGIIGTDKAGNLGLYRANGSNASVDSSVGMGYQPSIYIKSNTILEQTGVATANPNETGTYYEYSLSSDTVTAPTSISTDYDEDRTLADVNFPTDSRGQWFWVDPTQSVGEFGRHTFEAKFVFSGSTDSENIYQVDVDVLLGNGANADDYVEPSNLNSGPNVELSTITLPSGWTWDNPSQMTNSANGTWFYDAKFTSTNTNFNPVQKALAVVVSFKQDPNPTVPKGLSAIYNPTATLSTISIPNPATGRWEWVNGSQLLGDVDDQKQFEATFYPNDADNYFEVNRFITVAITQAPGEQAPNWVEAPTDLTADINTFLRDIQLPTDWEWNKPDTELTTVGKWSYSATFKPNSDNYATEVSNIIVEVQAAPIPEPSPKQDETPWLIIGLAGGGGLLLIILIVVFILAINKKGGGGKGGKGRYVPKSYSGAPSTRRPTNKPPQKPGKTGIR